MCKFLLGRGASPNAVCELKNTPFHCAFLNGSKQLIALFEQYKPDRHAVNALGSKPHQMENVPISELASTQRTLGEGSAGILSSRFGPQGAALLPLHKSVSAQAAVVATAQLSHLAQGLLRLGSKDFSLKDKESLIKQLGRKQSQSLSQQHKQTMENPKPTVSPR